MLAAADGELGALLVVGANPVAGSSIRAALEEHLRHRAGSFPHRDCGAGRCGLPAASLYEKTGTVTNTFGDVQLVRKAADRAGVKPDFEILVRLAGAMGVDVKTLVPFGKGGVTADLGQSRGAQVRRGRPPRRVACGQRPRTQTQPLRSACRAGRDRAARSGYYKLDRLNLFGGNDVPTEPGFVPVSALRSQPARSRPRTTDSLPPARWAATARRS